MYTFAQVTENGANRPFDLHNSSICKLNVHGKTCKSTTSKKWRCLESFGRKGSVKKLFWNFFQYSYGNICNGKFLFNKVAGFGDFEKLFSIGYCYGLIVGFAIVF